MSFSRPARLAGGRPREGGGGGLPNNPLNVGNTGSGFARPFILSLDVMASCV